MAEGRADDDDDDDAGGEKKKKGMVKSCPRFRIAARSKIFRVGDRFRLG